MNSIDFLNKYGATIQEEVNVKNLAVMSGEISVKKLYIPVGSQISSKFGKDTGRIIAAAKAGNVREEGSVVIVFQGSESRVLESSDYELRYEGLDETYQAAEGTVIVSLDIQLDDELLGEGVAREISRFLNQMRKTADFQIDERIVCGYMTESVYLKGILETYRDFLSEEALVVEWNEEALVDANGQEEFENDGELVVFYVKK